MAPLPVIDPWLRRLPRYLYLDELVRGARVLEVGCGAGRGADLLAERGASRVVGIDLSGDAVERARAAFRRPVLELAQVEDYAATPFADGDFDLILVPEAGELVALEGFLEELRRLRAPEGHVVVALPAPAPADALVEATPGGPATARAAARPLSTAGTVEREFAERIARIESLLGAVELISQRLCWGYSFAASGPGGPRPAHLFTGLAAGDEPTTHVIVVAGPAARRARGHFVAQLPWAGLAVGATTPYIAYTSGRLGPGDASTLGRLRVRLLEAEVGLGLARKAEKAARAQVATLEQQLAGCASPQGEAQGDRPALLAAERQASEWGTLERQARERLIAQRAVQEGRTELQSLRMRLDEAESALAARAQGLVEVQEAAARALAEQDALRRRLADTESENAQREAIRDEAARALASLRSERESAEARAEAAAQAERTARQRVAALEGQHLGLERRAAKAEEDAAAARADAAQRLAQATSVAQSRLSRALDEATRSLAQARDAEDREAKARREAERERDALRAALAGAGAGDGRAGEASPVAPQSAKEEP